MNHSKGALRSYPLIRCIVVESDQNSMRQNSTVAGLERRRMNFHVTTYILLTTYILSNFAAEKARRNEHHIANHCVATVE